VFAAFAAVVVVASCISSASAAATAGGASVWLLYDGGCNELSGASVVFGIEFGGFNANYLKTRQRKIQSHDGKIIEKSYTYY
jgi:hypothetical protein